MKKPYQIPRHQSRKSRIRAVLGQMAKSNSRERHAVSIDTAEKDVRARLQRDKTDMSHDEIEQLVREIMALGSKPTTAAVLAPGSIPAEVVAARRAARKRQVKSGRARRKRDGG